MLETTKPSHLQAGASSEFGSTRTPRRLLPGSETFLPVKGGSPGLGEKSRDLVNGRRARAAGRPLERPAPPTFIRPDERRTLVEEFWHLVYESRADGFLFENVRSITHPRHRLILDALIAAAQGAGYRTTLFLANAADYGVPQRRHRVFLLGSRHTTPAAPPVTHADPKKAADLGLKPYETAGPALEPYAATEFFEHEEIVEGRWAEHLRTVPPGWNYKGAHRVGRPSKPDLGHGDSLLALLAEAEP